MVQVADMRLKRGAHACAAAHDQLFAIGGYDAEHFISTGEEERGGEGERNRCT